MPMIDVTATEGTFADPHGLAQAVAAALMSIEEVPDIPMFRQNTAGFVHEIPAGMLSDSAGDTATASYAVRSSISLARATSAPTTTSAAAAATSPA